MNDPNYLMNKDIALENIKNATNSTCKILIENIEKGIGFFLKFNQSYFEINFLITFYSIISQDLFRLKKDIKILTEDNKYYDFLSNKNDRIIQYLEEQNITLIEIKDNDIIKTNVNFLLCDLNFNYNNKNIFIYSYHSLPLFCHIIKINELNQFKIDITEDNNKCFYCSPVISYETLKVIGIYTNLSQNNKIGTFIEVLKNTYSNIINIKLKENNLNKFILIYKKGNSEKTEIFNDEFVKKNKENCFINLNGKIIELSNFIDNSEISDEKFIIELTFIPMKI